MKKYRIPALLLSLVLMLNLLVLPAAAIEEPELQCTHAILVDANYDEVLYEVGGHDKVYPASITKVMTALLVLEAIDSGKLTKDQQITAGPTTLQDMSGNYSTANLEPGDVLTVEQLLYCLLLPSANEAGNILAVAVDGSIEAFVEHMNTRAKELGCKGTHFVNPHGLHDPDHYTTAYDISLYMTEALKHELFRTIIHTATYVLPATAHMGEQTFYNTNALISNFHYSGYVYDKCIGGKTGTTDEAGRCLVAAAESGDTLLISVILGSGVVGVLCTLAARGLTGHAAGSMFGYIAVFLLGMGCSVLGILGDLFASAIKRQLGIKAYGPIFPGHGGIMDRFDSVLFITPLVALAVWFRTMM